ncbi:MAG: type II toxin-antitoxin system RelE/ParE family toxin [Alphaproteobacteria bacterium]|nr:type II toxin-antitoxin system RelE/ParE family toxin [Alphaproteobacteria bacterium]
MKTRYEKQAVKTLLKMPPKVAAAIRDKVSAFAEQGTSAHVDVKPLKGVMNAYRLRQGDWRVLMYKHGHELIITAIKPRGDAYK